jgi:hypothetical protein
MRLSEHRLDQPRLADPGGPLEQEDRAPTVARVLQRRVRGCELGLALEERSGGVLLICRGR